MKPLFITDLDHTFLRSDHSVSQYSRGVWNERAKNAHLSIATARSYSKSMEFLDGLDLRLPLILLDGAMVVTPKKEIIDLKSIPKPLVEAIVEEGRGFGICPFVIGLVDKELSEVFCYTSHLNEIQRSVLSNYANDPRLQLQSRIQVPPMTLKVVYFGYQESLTALNAHLLRTFGDAISTKLSPENYTGGYFLTILHPTADKSHALITLCEYLGREPHELTVFGDSLNDIGMFRLAGRAVAVANALDELKIHATHILPHTNDEDGVAKFLETGDT